MKTLYSLFVKIFPRTQVNQPDKSTQNIFDYPTKERMKLLRTAGREARHEQLLLLKKYEAKFGQV